MAIEQLARVTPQLPENLHIMDVPAPHKVTGEKIRSIHIERLSGAVVEVEGYGSDPVVALKYLQSICDRTLLRG